MLIYAITEYYPSLYKPYFDTQFAQFLADGHSLRIFALGGGDRSCLEPKVLKYGLDRLTEQLPTGRRTLAFFLPRLVRGIFSAPASRLRAIRHGVRSAPKTIENVADAARLLILPAEPPDLCLVHNLLAAREVLFLRALYPGVPVAFYYHGGELSGMTTVDDEEAAATFASADVVFTNTRRSKAHAVNRGCDPERIVVSPVGFSMDEFPRRDERPYRRGGRLNVVSIGRLSPEKGFSYSVEAARQLFEDGDVNFRYKLIGGGPLLGTIRAQVADAGIDDCVEVLGPVSRDRLNEELRSADVLILPSIVVGTWEENQACVVQEAMLMQTVVIATVTGGVPESLAPEMHAFLVPEGDASALAARLREVASLDVAQLRELGNAGRRFAEARYDIRQLNAQILSEAIARKAFPSEAVGA